MNPDSPNVGRFFLTCRQNMPCRSDQIFQHRWQEARKNGWKGEREEKASGLLEVDTPLDPHQARKKQELENETVVIQVPSLPDGQVGGGTREVREKAAMDGSTEKVDGTRRFAAEVVPAIRTHPPHYARTVACLF